MGTRYEFHEWIDLRRQFKLLSADREAMEDEYVDLVNRLKDDPTQQELLLELLPTIIDDPVVILTPDVAQDIAEFYALSRSVIISDALRANRDPYPEISFNRQEETHHYLGRPYFKVYPAIIDALWTTELHIDCDSLNLPFIVYEVRFPKINGRWPYNPQSALVGRFKDGKTGRECITMLWRDDSTDALTKKYPGLRPSAICRCYFSLKPGKTVETAVLRMEMPEIERPMTELMVRVCLGVALFGTNNHEVIMPDIPRKFERKYQDAKDRGDVSGMERIAAKRPNSYTVGRELDLPSLRPNGYSSNDPTGHQLNFSHIRRGHLALQAHGPGGRERKLIFRAPTVVRPDLPFRQHGYSVGKTIEREKACSTKTTG